MTSPIYYRREAERCRRLAHSSKGTEAERRLLVLANDYDRIATELDRHPDVARGPGPSAAHHVDWRKAVSNRSDAAIETSPAPTLAVIAPPPCTR